MHRFGGTFDYDQKSERLEEVNLELESPDVWNEPERAQALGKEKVALEQVVETIVFLEQGCVDVEELLELAVEENDQETLDEAEKDLAIKIAKNIDDVIDVEDNLQVIAD